MTTRVLAAMIVLFGVGGLAIWVQMPFSPPNVVSAATTSPSPVTGTASPPATPQQSATATPTVTLIPARPTAVRTPFPDTPTPALPEEGGPPGGVIGGHLYVDQNGNGRRDDGEGTTGGTVIVRGLDLVDGGHAYLLPAVSDTSGYWQLRGVPDGSYQVYWQPPITDDQLDKTSPPAQTIVLNPNQTIRAIAQTVEIRGASRIFNIDFGVPPQLPFADAKVRLPNTGRSGSSGSATMWLLVGGLALSIAAAGVLTVRRR